MDPHDIPAPENDPEEGDAMKDEIVTELRAIRPTPRPEFRRDLDRRAAAGFPPRRRDHAREVETRDEDPRRSESRPSLRDRLGFRSSLRLGPVMAGAAVACAIATAVVVSGPEQLGLQGPSYESATSQSAVDAPAMEPAEVAPEGADSFEQGGGATMDERLAAPDENGSVPPGASVTEEWMTRHSAANSGQGQSAVEDSDSITQFSQPAPGNRGGDPIAANRNRRAVERDASMTLATEPREVPEVVSGVLRVVGQHGGIVLSSTTRGGQEGQAGADFQLKIPSGNLSQALADLSALATVRDRRESSLDITAPTVTVGDRLQEAQAKVRGLLKQLAEATTDSERETIEIDLGPAQRRVARLRSQLDRLQRRANFSDVSVMVVTGEAGALPEEAEWTLGDAADDALRLLTVVAGVLLVAAAILAPLLLLIAVVLLGYRLWLRGARERALRMQTGPKSVASGGRGERDLGGDPAGGGDAADQPS